MIALVDHADGTIVGVRAHAAARRNRIVGEHAGSLRVEVTQAPEKGKANKAIAAVLAEGLSLRKNQIELLAGEASERKRFLMRGIARDELAARIERALAVAEGKKSPSE